MNGQTALPWSLKVAAQLLEPAEREVVLGDLAEGRAGLHQAVYQVLDLGVRRHGALWLRWRPWLTGPGLALPGSFLLMGVSLSVSQACLSATVQPTTGNLTWLLTQLCLLLGWSWTGGFVVGRLSRRTLAPSIVLCLLPCVDCLSKFQHDSLSAVCLLWFLIPAAAGARQGLRGTGIQLPVAIGIAAALVLAMVLAWQGGAHRWWTPPWWLVDGVMSWPAVYLVAKASRRVKREQIPC